MGNSINDKVVAEKAIKDILNYIDLAEYEEGATYKSVIKEMLEAVEEPRNRNNLQKQVHSLVDGGCFRISNYDILEFLNTLDLNENNMKIAEDDPLKVYSNVVWHAIKRYIKS